MMNYRDFLKTKVHVVEPCGDSFDISQIHPKLYDFQKAIVLWACHKGRCAIFADCGLGKTFMQVEIVAPLCVSKQTVNEAKKIDVSIKYIRTASEAINGINITNYEMIEAVGNKFDAVVLDESSILKNLAGKTRKKLIKMFKKTPYRLCCTATPCPNDIAELGNHSEFLGVMRYPEMLASFFVHDNTTWRMKGYAHDAFYRWLASWGICINSPSDIGFDDSIFVLPHLKIKDVFVKTAYKQPGTLFFLGLKGVQDRIGVRKDTVKDRVASAAKLILDNPNEQWLCWCGLNKEADILKKTINGDCINIQGSDSIQKKEDG